MVIRESAHLAELHVAQPGTAFEAKDRSTGIRRARTDPSYRNRDQARLRAVPVLGYDERAAVGAVAAVLGRVVARVELQLTCVRPRRYGNRVAAAAEMEVGKAECREGDERE